MFKFAANLTMLFTELPFLERFKAARETGFKSVEFLFPYDYVTHDIQRLLDENGLNMVLFNLPAGNWGSGERGITNNPRKTEEFRRGVEEAIVWAQALKVPRINCLAGKTLSDISSDEQWDTLKDNIRYAADVLHENGLELLLEFINHYDVPGFMLNTSKQALKMIDEVGKPNVYLQYDIYHAQKEEGNLAGIMREHIARIKHIQIADNPGRHQPGTGEINYRFLLNELDKLGYEGYVSLEYIPKPDTWKSLEWVATHGFSL
ncbi:MAG TPA: hydroxypyruvate isomerase [Atribacteraceae bacterium]|nr:hydroxypyruvate isomerase [Atribacteraceae bacterium]